MKTNTVGRLESYANSLDILDTKEINYFNQYLIRKNKIRV